MNLEALNLALRSVNTKLVASARQQDIALVNLAKAQADFNELVLRAIKDLSDGQKQPPPN